jgi:hypothetical protein
MWVVLVLRDRTSRTQDAFLNDFPNGYIKPKQAPVAKIKQQK